MEPKRKNRSGLCVTAPGTTVVEERMIPWTSFSPPPLKGTRERVIFLVDQKAYISHGEYIWIERADRD